MISFPSFLSDHNQPFCLVPLFFISFPNQQTQVQFSVIGGNTTNGGKKKLDPEFHLIQISSYSY